MTVEHRSYFAPELEVVRGAGGDGRTVEGIAVPYGRPQRIYEGLTEQFARGAFNHQLGAMHRVHVAREHVAMGGSPIGRIVEARDDAAGLWVRSRISATPTGDETLTLIEDGVLSELSIGFRQARPSWSRTLADGVIERVKADLTELSVVLRGAYGQKAKVTGVRAEQATTLTLDESRALAASIPILSRAVLVR
jgi:HK97 family phage prohead protease